MRPARRTKNSRFEAQFSQADPLRELCRVLAAGAAGYGYYMELPILLAAWYNGRFLYHKVV